MPEKRIFIVDDEPDVLKTAAEYLSNKGFSVSCFPDGKGFFWGIEGESPDLIILDLMLPDIHGFDICRRLRSDSRYSSIPIIMMTAQGEEPDRVTGLEIGADDYMVKPVSLNELNARIKTVLRRKSPGQQEKVLKIGDYLIMDPNRFGVVVNGQKIALTRTEFGILYCLASRVGNVFSREKILDHLWGEEKIVVQRTIDVHVKHLREKMGEAGKYIQNVRGVGYKFEVDA